jgi:hypothetical protein
LSRVAGFRLELRGFALVAIIFCSTFSLAQATAPADTVVLNARVYTVNAAKPWASAVAIHDGKIVAVGTNDEIKPLRGPSTQVIDAGGRLVLPGFTDCHSHFLDGSLSLTQVNLDDARTVSEIQQRVKEYAAAHPDLPWVLGRGWNYTVFGTAGLPNKKDLDAVVADRPVYLEGFDGHTWWANSKALEAAGISRKTHDPAGGSFVRDPRSGEPTGAVKEDTADEMMRRVIPRPSHDQVVAALRQGMQAANRVGLVRIISPDGVHVEGGDFQVLDIYNDLRQQGQLTIRVDVARRIQPPQLRPNDLAKIQSAHDRYHDEWISAGKAKFFVDGVIETRTAAMLAPYANSPGHSGDLLWEPANYRAAVLELDKNRVQIFSHAIGDRAIRLALDAYGEAALTNHTSDARHRIEHIEDISAVDVTRFGKLGVIASFQPLHAYPDDDVLKLWSGNLGPERAQRGWMWHSIEASGGVLAFGSDWPIVTQSPWPGVQNALTRQTVEGEPRGGWLPRERISLDDAIKGYTLNAAFAGHREKTEGSLEPGKLADLIVLSQDLFKIEPSDIIKTEVLLTMVGGKIVYQSPNATGMISSNMEAK